MGLVDVKDHEFDEKYQNMKKHWPEQFAKWVEGTKGRHRSLNETIRKCMLKPVRVAAGLGNPPNKYSNNRTESMNHVIKEQINNNAVDLITFLSRVEKMIFNQQKDEMIKAIYRMGEYRLVRAEDCCSIGMGKDE